MGIPQDDHNENLSVLREGAIQFYGFTPQAYSMHNSVIPHLMPVFYNPVQEFNRSFSAMVYRTYQSLRDPAEHGHPLRICDCMAASGIRILRLAKFLPPPVQFIANDMSPDAVELIHKNTRLNALSPDIVSTSCYDAISLFTHLNSTHNPQDIIDIDPFGTPNIYIEPALRCLRSGGVLSVTATDTPVLFGVKGAACQRKYGLRALHSSFQKEAGLRLLLYFIASRAHPYLRYLQPLLSISCDHYIRVYVRILKGNAGITANLAASGYLLWCRACEWCGTRPLDLRFEHNPPDPSQILAQNPFLCPLCGERVEYGGPAYLGSLHDTDFVHHMQEDSTTATPEEIPSLPRIMKFLALMASETQSPPFYYHLHRICDRYALSVPPTEQILQRIHEAGFSGVLTHIEPRAIKTTFPLPDLLTLLRALQL